MPIRALTNAAAAATMARVNPVELPPPLAAGGTITMVAGGPDVVGEPVAEGVGEPVGVAVLVGEAVDVAPPSVTWNVPMASRRSPEAMVWVAATAFSPAGIPPGTVTLWAKPPSVPTPMPSATTMPAMETRTEEHAGLPQNPRPAICTVVPTPPEDGSTSRAGAPWAWAIVGPSDDPNVSRTMLTAPTTRALFGIRTSVPSAGSLGLAYGSSPRAVAQAVEIAGSAHVGPDAAGPAAAPVRNPDRLS
jgi:hypothetical protein